MDASIELKKCQDAVGDLRVESSSLNLSDDNKGDAVLEQEIWDVGDGYGYGCKALRSFLDTSAPSDAAEAKQQFAKGGGVIEDMIGLGTDKYVEMGGRRGDL